MQTSPETDAPRTVGRYTLYREIASGGMATVHVGRLNGPVGFARTVAVKRLHPHLAKDPEFVAMLLDEARVAARVRHPNVVQTLDVVATDGEVFLVMEYVAGESFARLLKRARGAGLPVPPRIAAAVVVALLHGLHAAHEATGDRGEPLGIVHRDVSPQNIIVGLDGVPRVLDFGIAKAVGRLQVTREGELKGKLAYMAPEQLAGGTMTRRCDIYAAGIVLWEALVGDYLFRAETEAATLARAADPRVQAPSLRIPGLDPAFDAIVLRALAKQPAHRYPSAREMALDLERRVAVATTSEVAEWVHSLVGSDLDERASLVSAIVERSREGTTPSAAQGTTARRPRAQVATAIALAATVVLALAVSTMVRRSRLRAAPQEAEGYESASASPVAPSTILPVTTESPRPAAPPLAASDLPTALPSPPRRPEGPRPSRSSPSGRGSSVCDPPYVTDEKGHRHYKAECL